MPGRDRSWWAVVALACTAQFLVVLDASIVNVALPAIGADLVVDTIGLTWVVTAYALVLAGFLLLGGRLGDLCGHGRTFTYGLVLFTAASTVGGMAPTAEVLVAARAVQALGAALLAPAGLALLTTRVPDGPVRVRALAVWTALGSAGGAAGNLLGGVLTEFLSWRATLLVNLPIGVAVLVFARNVLPSSDAPVTHRRIDVLGATTVTVALVAVTFALTNLRAHGPADPWTLVALGLGAAAAVVFVIDELYLARHPLLPLRLFGLRSVVTGNLAVLLAAACLMPMWFFLSLAMQQVLGLSAALTGLGFLPYALVTVLAGVRLAPALLPVMGARGLLAAGSLVAAVGFWWHSKVGVDSGYLDGLLGPAVLTSLGVGLLNTPLTTTTLAGVPPADAGAAAGLMTTGKQAGGAVGLAALAVVATPPPGPAGDLGAVVAGLDRAFLGMAALMVVVALLAWVALPSGRPAAVDRQ